MYLIGRDGISGPTIGQLQEETTGNFKGAVGEHFTDATFVDAVKDWHEAKLLAEGGFSGSGHETLEQRYERAEAGLFAYIEAMRRERETRVTGDESKLLRVHGGKTLAGSAAEYGSAEHYRAFAAPLAGTASGNQV